MPRRKSDGAFAKRIGSRVAAERQRVGLSGQALADLAGVSRALVGEIERGSTVPSVATLFALADVLGFPVDSLRRPTDATTQAALVGIASWRARAERAEHALESIRALLKS